ncbi:MAG: FecR family protein, partial [Chitinophagaceae bacterium]
MDKRENYIHYNAEDFLKDSYFLVWMRNEDKQVNVFWEQWQAEHPDKKEVIIEAKRHYQELVSFDKTDYSKVEEREVWQRIEAGIEVHYKKRIFRMRLLEWSVAAVIALLLASGWFLRHNTHRTKENFVIVQTGNGQKEFILSDSSEIFLNCYTTLKYRPDNRREFWLKGQAYFNIKHASTIEDAAIPFMVHTGIEDVAVLGTSFTVKSIDSTARVVLISGKVKTSVGKTSFIMKPGQKTSWNKGSFTSVQVDPQLYV